LQLILGIKNLEVKSFQALAVNYSILQPKYELKIRRPNSLDQGSQTLD